VTDWKPTAEQKKQWDEQGFFTLKNVIPYDTAMEIRGVIKNQVLTPDVQVQQQDLDPMDPMNSDTPAARTARLRKLAQFCCRAPLIWHEVHCNERLLSIARYFLGDDIVIKFDSCFLKPPKTGSATPWHQDNGLWCDGETEPFNFWMALDPATRANGCMQFIPRTHTLPVYEHVIYNEKAIHGEIPRDIVKREIESKGLLHIELDPGDAVFWHSSLFHYSPPNTSDKGRIAIAGVYTTPEIVRETGQSRALLHCLRDGEVIHSFPPEPFIFEGRRVPFPGYARAPEYV
jgi:phytanoyl-CoA hydroxylase